MTSRPQGGVSPLEPRSLKWPLADASVKEWLTDKGRQTLLSTTTRPDEIDLADFDAIYFTGGHAVMWDFPDDAGLQRITREIYERGGIVSSVCHGYCGLLNTTLSDGSLLVAGRRLTGYSWVEEVLAGVAKKVPYNAGQEMLRRGALYEKALLPFVSKGRHRWPTCDRPEPAIGQGNRGTGRRTSWQLNSSSTSSLSFHRRYRLNAFAEPVLSSDAATLLERQRAAFLGAAPPDYAQRMVSLTRLRAAVLAYRHEVEEAISADFGHRSRHETGIMELVGVIQAINYLVCNLRRFMRPERRHVGIFYRTGRAHVEYQPKGVVDVMAPGRGESNLAALCGQLLESAAFRTMGLPGHSDFFR